MLYQISLEDAVESVREVGISDDERKSVMVRKPNTDVGDTGGTSKR